MFTEFTEIPWPEHANVVYVIFFKPQGSNDFTPFYVGQSSKTVGGRVGDYVSAKFSAPTDFKVGKAVMMFRERDCEVIIRYMPTNDRKGEEVKFVRLQKEDGHELLNHLPGYDYKKADEHEELRKIDAFVERVIHKALPPSQA